MLCFVLFYSRMTSSRSASTRDYVSRDYAPQSSRAYTPPPPSRDYGSRDYNYDRGPTSRDRGPQSRFVGYLNYISHIICINLKKPGFMLLKKLILI
jgi:hypothetical protein